MWHLGGATQPYTLSHIVVSPGFVHVVLMAGEAISTSGLILLARSPRDSHISLLLSQWSVPSFRYPWPTVLARNIRGITDLYKHARTNCIKDKVIKTSAI